MLESGTAVMVIVNQDVDLKALDGREYHQQKAEGAAQKDLTYEKLKGDLDADHLEGAAVANIARILTKYVPELARFKANINNHQYKMYAKHCVKPAKTKYHPLWCSGYNEAYTQGNHDVILDMFIHQLGISNKELEGRLFPVSGDQSTVTHVHTLLAQTSTCNSWFTSHTWFLPVIELWHMNWAFLKCIYNAHWSSRISKGDIGLCFAAD